MLLTWHIQVCFIFNEYIKNQAIARYGKLSKKVARDNRHLNRYPNVVPCKFSTNKVCLNIPTMQYFGISRQKQTACFWELQYKIALWDKCL